MADLLLWRRLTDTDWRSIHGEAAPSRTGGGAMHISLGVDRPDFPIKQFFGNPKSKTTMITTESQPPSVPKASLTIDGNPRRRGGEWRITDQFTHRHAAWRPAADFPTRYDPTDRPIVLLVYLGGKYHVRFSSERRLQTEIPVLAKVVETGRRAAGITRFDMGWTKIFGLPRRTAVLKQFKRARAAADAIPQPTFDPKDIVDGRRTILAEIIRRQGQGPFRKRLLTAYGRRCAISKTSVEHTLQAAHISAYRGPETNDVSNGLLLRADIHTLFDLGLITINAENFRTIVSRQLDGTEYKKFHAKQIVLPRTRKLRPSRYSLAEHNAFFQE